MNTHQINGRIFFPNGAVASNVTVKFFLISDVAINNGQTIPREVVVNTDINGMLDFSLVVPDDGCWTWVYVRPIGKNIYFCLGPQSSNELDLILSNETILSNDAVLIYDTPSFSNLAINTLETIGNTPIEVDWGDGTTPTVHSGIGGLSHNYNTQGIYEIRIKNPELVISFSAFNNPYLTGDLFGIAGMINLQSLHVSNNSVYGDLSFLSDMIHLEYLRMHDIGVYGYINNLSALVDISYLNLTNTQVMYSTGLENLTKINQIYLQGLYWDQPTIDSVLYDLYVMSSKPRISSYGRIYINGNNASPSGPYIRKANPCPVSETTLGKEIIYELLNDICGVGFNKWQNIYFS